MRILHSPLLHFNDRPPAIAVDTVVIHSMFAESTPDPYAAESCVNVLDQCGLSAHFLIDKAGTIVEMVAPEQRAWHAGVSCMPENGGSREGVNDFSIGVELVGEPTSSFTDAQYQSVVALVQMLSARFPIRFIVGHDEIARPYGRKVDPGPGFDWAKLESLLPEYTVIRTGGIG